MKKVLLVTLVLLISVAFVSTVFAQAKPEAKPAEKPAPAPEKAPVAAPEKAPAPEKAEKAKEAPKPKPKAAGFVGKVESINGKMMMVKSKKEAVGFDVSKPAFKGYKAIGDVKVGDMVAAKYTKDGVMITKIAGAKAEKPAKEKPKAEKKVEKEAPKKEESKPAPAPEKKPAEAPAKK